MKKIVLITCVLIFGHTLFPQGTIVFVNRGGVSTTAAPGRVYAPVYREDPNDATHRISGNTPAGVPPGNTFYNGAAYVAAGQGPTFIATLWGLNSNAAVGDPGNNNLLLLQNGTTTF